jgi:hypothetical protein
MMIFADRRLELDQGPSVLSGLTSIRPRHGLIGE